MLLQTHFPQHAVYIVFLLYVQWGETPLWKASFRGHQKCMELLIDAGANVDIFNEVSVSRAVRRFFRWGGQKKGMDLLLVTQGVGPGGGNSPSHPAGGELFTFCMFSCRDKQEKDT